ncbi:MAG: DUF5074 domain-containing protein [Candidatus Diapherotrites archaeon]|nr:DUF5074 domain-containing protein [Candidatus Diapherotrites archaeon]
MNAKKHWTDKVILAGFFLLALAGLTFYPLNVNALFSIDPAPISPQVFVTANANGTASILNASTGIVRHVQLPRPVAAAINVETSPTNGMAYVLYENSLIGETTFEVGVLDALNGRFVKKLQGIIEYFAWDMEISPDGKYLLVATAEGGYPNLLPYLYVFDTNLGKLTEKIELSNVKTPADGVPKIAVSYDNRYAFVSNNYRKEAYVYNLDTKTLTGTIPLVPTNEIGIIELAPTANSAMWLWVPNGPGTTIRTRTAIVPSLGFVDARYPQLKAPNVGAGGLKYDPLSGILAMAVTNKIYNVTSNCSIELQNPPPGYYLPHSMNFSPISGHLYLTAGDDFITVNPAACSLVSSMTLPDTTNTGALTPDGAFYAATTVGNIYVVPTNATSPSQIKKYNIGNTPINDIEAVHSVQFN